MHDTTPITVAFELFGPVAETTGDSRVQVELPPESTVAAAIDALIGEHPQVREILQAAVIAADGVMVKRDAVLVGGEELVVVTLVSGG